MTGHEHSDKAQRNRQLYFKRTAVIGNLIAFRILQCTDFLMRKVSVMGQMVQNQCCFPINASHFFQTVTDFINCLKAHMTLSPVPAQCRTVKTCQIQIFSLQKFPGAFGEDSCIMGI